MTGRGPSPARHECRLSGSEKRKVSHCRKNVNRAVSAPVTFANFWDAINGLFDVARLRLALLSLNLA